MGTDRHGEAISRLFNNSVNVPKKKASNFCHGAMLQNVKKILLQPCESVLWLSF
jgi:hypothetical protein